MTEESEAGSAVAVGQHYVKEVSKKTNTQRKDTSVRCNYTRVRVSILYALYVLPRASNMHQITVVSSHSFTYI